MSRAPHLARPVSPRYVNCVHFENSPRFLAVSQPSGNILGEKFRRDLPGHPFTLPTPASLLVSRTANRFRVGFMFLHCRRQQPCDVGYLVMFLAAQRGQVRKFRSDAERECSRRQVFLGVF